MTKIEQILTNIKQLKDANHIKRQITLIAVSKTKPIEDILQAYQCGIRDFGENYVEEISTKQPQLPPDIRWHFIGHLQSNKIKKLLVPLYCIQTVDRISLADKLNSQLEKMNTKILILIQVLTSDQDTKSGCPVDKLDELYEFISNKCPQLKFNGLMTIGKYKDIDAFKQMKGLKELMCLKYSLCPQQFELSMGMSEDYETAIEYGSTNVRIGSLIFGPREYKKNKQ